MSMIPVRRCSSGENKLAKQFSNIHNDLRTLNRILTNQGSDIDNMGDDGVSYDSLNLDNCIDVAQNAPERGNLMAYKREWVNLGSDENGKPKRIQISGKTQDERNIAIAKALLLNGTIWKYLNDNDLSNMDLSVLGAHSHKPELVKTDFCKYAWDCYHTYKEQTLAATSKSRETSALNVLCRFFEGKAVEDIRVADVQAWMNKRAEDGMSATTISDQKKVLAWIFKNAVEDKLISDNPATSSRLQMCGYESEGTIALPVDEYKRLVKLIPQLVDPCEQMLLGLFTLTGMRRSEVLGLQWQDLDFSEKWVHVQRARTCPNGVFRDGPTKSKAGNRFIPMFEPLYDCLMKYRRDSGYVITYRNDEPFNTDNAYTETYERMIEHAGLQGQDVTALVFRTTFATMLASTSVPPKTLQAWMGHSKFDTTMDIYAKVDKKQMSRYREVLQEIFASERVI